MEIERQKYKRIITGLGNWRQKDKKRKKRKNEKDKKPRHLQNAEQDRPSEQTN